MIRHRCFWRCGGVWLGIALLWMWPKNVSAVMVAFDNANPTDAAYADGWDLGDNGGFGFGPWGGIGNAFTQEIDTFGQPDNDIGTPAFRYGAEYYTADRPFANPMQAGQRFKMDFDKYAFDTSDPGKGAYIEQDSFIQLSSAGPIADETYGRFVFYDWIGKYTFGGETTTYNADEWGIGADSAFDNLHGGAALPVSGGLFKPGYTGPDSTDGFTFILETPTVDTYRFRVLDDNVTKVNVSGALSSMSDPDGDGPLPPGDVVGQPLNLLTMWFTPGDYTNGQPAAYFTNLTIESASVGGDYNGNGVVDAADYVAWRLNPAAHGGTPGGYNTWRSNFGASGSGSFHGGSVPEPASCLLMLLGLIALACHRRAH